MNYNFGPNITPTSCVCGWNPTTLEAPGVPPTLCGAVPSCSPNEHTYRSGLLDMPKVHYSYNANDLQAFYYGAASTSMDVVSPTARSLLEKNDNPFCADKVKGHSICMVNQTELQTQALFQSKTITLKATTKFSACTNNDVQYCLFVACITSGTGSTTAFDCDAQSYNAQAVAPCSSGGIQDIVIESTLSATNFHFPDPTAFSINLFADCGSIALNRLMQYRPSAGNNNAGDFGIRLHDLKCSDIAVCSLENGSA